jgi:hypothetical protein
MGKIDRTTEIFGLIGTAHPMKFTQTPLARRVLSRVFHLNTMQKAREKYREMIIEIF